MPRRLTIVEVGPRDGLQNERSLVSTADKIEFVQPPRPAHLPVIEVSAFVSPKWVPQMADARRGVRGHRACAGHSLHRAGAEPPGLERAMAAGVTEVAIFASSTGDLQPEEHQSEHRRVADDVRGPSAIARSRPVCACADTCPPPSAVRSKAPSIRDRSPRVAERLADLGVFEVAISDTIGIAHPGQVRTSSKPCWRASPRIASRCTSTIRAARRSPTCWRRCRSGSATYDASVGRARRLPVRAGRGRQPGHRRSDLHAGRVGDRNRACR